MKRAIALHDLSSMGRCSLAVIIPVLSCLKVQVCAIPTEVLSTHTGGFGQPAIEGLPNFSMQAMHHYVSLQEEFDCIYAGYLGSVDKIKEVTSYYKAFPRAWHVLDPVMGDNGKAYARYDDQMVDGIRRLVSDAHMITPNPTEAALLLDIPYQAMRSDAEWLDIITRLHALGPQQVVITNASTAEHSLLVYVSDKQQLQRVIGQRIDAHYPGTGDIYASVLIGKMLAQMPLFEAAEYAARFVEKTIQTTKAAGAVSKYGVLLEECLGYLFEEREENS